MISVESTGNDGAGNIGQLALRSYEYDEKGRPVNLKEKIFTDDPGNSTLRTTTLLYDMLDRISKEVNHW